MRETEILVEQQPSQGVLVCDHAGLVINKFSSGMKVEMHLEVIEKLLEAGATTEAKNQVSRPGGNPVANLK